MNRRARYWTTQLAWIAASLGSATGCLGQDSTDPLDVPMRLELQLDASECAALENVTLTLRIVNPNPFTVRLRGFEFGYIEPQIYGTSPGGEQGRVYIGAAGSALRSQPLVVPGGGSLELHRFLYKYFAPDRAWPAEPGQHQLAAQCTIETGWIDDENTKVNVQWDANAAPLMVRTPTSTEEAAIAFLRTAFAERSEKFRAGTALASASGKTFYIDLYARFIQRFPDTPYTPEIRCELAKHLLAALTGGERRSLSAQDAEDYYRWFVDAASFCFDKGSPYSDALLCWDPSAGFNPVMELAHMRGDVGLLRRVAEELDARMPQDREGALCRRALVLAQEGFFQEARNTIQTMVEEYPGTKTTQGAQRAVEELEARAAQSPPE